MESFSSLEHIMYWSIGDRGLPESEVCPQARPFGCFQAVEKRNRIVLVVERCREQAPIASLRSTAPIVEDFRRTIFGIQHLFNWKHSLA